MQTSDNKMKTFNDFADEAFDFFCKSEIKVNILIIQSNLYAAYAFEEGCKAQRRSMVEQHLLYYLSENPHDENVAKEESKYPLAHNPFSSPQNNEQ